jgi:Ca-activated chloride channel homolog
MKASGQMCKLLLALLALHGTVRAQAPAEAQDATIKVVTRLLTVGVTVTDRHNRHVPSLKREMFAVFDNDRRQELAFFAGPDAPASIAVAVDVSDSMSINRKRVLESVRRLVRNSRSDNEYFLVLFSDQAELVSARALTGDEMIVHLAGIRMNGDTSLYDGCYLGLEALRRARYQRRALWLISDGQDNRSRHTVEEVRRLALAGGATIYAIGLPSWLHAYNQLPPAFRPTTGRPLLDELAEATGGVSHFLTNPNLLPDACEGVAEAVRSQYTLAYYLPDGGPGNESGDHLIRVEVIGRLRGESNLPLRVRHQTRLHVHPGCRRSDSNTCFESREQTRARVRPAATST